MYRSLIALAALTLLAGVTHAQSDQESRPRGEHQGPPKVAFEVCLDSVQGDPCSFEGQRGDTLQGRCDERTGLFHPHLLQEQHFHIRLQY